VPTLVSWTRIGRVMLREEVARGSKSSDRSVLLRV